MGKGRTKLLRKLSSEHAIAQVTQRKVCSNARSGIVPCSSSGKHTLGKKAGKINYLVIFLVI